MDKIKLTISKRDWLYIIAIGAFFGFSLSLLLYVLNDEFKKSSTIIFSTLTAINISFFSFILITLSNEYILPKVKEKFWYPISFMFSFFSGFLGFTSSFYIGFLYEVAIVKFIYAYWFYFSLVIGLVTFLVGLILHHFISMKHKNEHISKEILETKIKALENELNPHFLFNALNSISELVYIDKQKAERATLGLSKFLRNAINKDSLVSIQSELDMVKTYLQIENIRFEDNIKLEVQLEENIDFILVPKFSIQLLVENAIKHGYKQKELKVKIWINSDKIIVSNDGKLSKTISFGTGLSNLSRRLVLLNIGKLKHKIEDSKMVFIIDFKE